jgi:hypothetical protein
MTRNVAASVRARLKQHADAAKEDFNLTLTRYGLERLLYRLSVSRHAPGFLLKGALHFSLWYDATKQTQWKAFLKKNRLAPADFGDLVMRLRTSLQAVGVL